MHFPYNGDKNIIAKIYFSKKVATRRIAAIYLILHDVNVLMLAVQQYSNGRDLSINSRSLIKTKYSKANITVSKTIR